MCGQEISWDISNAYLRKKWGRSFVNANGETREYTDGELEELERIYQMQSAEYKGNISPRMEYNLQKISKLELEQSRSIAEGDDAKAKRYADMVNTIKKSEGMTAADAKPLEKMSIDGLIVALEKKGILQQGKIVDKATLLKLLAQERGFYSASRDIVDAMMMGIINTMRSNNGESELEELPVSAQVEDNLGELRPAMTKSEKAALEQLGLTLPRKERKCHPTNDTAK